MIKTDCIEQNSIAYSETEGKIFRDADGEWVREGRTAGEEKRAVEGHERLR